VHLTRGNKELALLCLKKKKFQEGLINKTEQQLLNLETLTQTIEFALVEEKVLKGLKIGNTVLRDIQQEMSLENVYKLMEETQEAIEYQQVRFSSLFYISFSIFIAFWMQQISDALSGQFTERDEEAISMELEELERLKMVEALPEIPSQAIIPPVATTIEQPTKGKFTEREFLYDQKYFYQSFIIESKESKLLTAPLEN
jgi:charged multivesicular body protein 6